MDHSIAPAVIALTIFALVVIFVLARRKKRDGNSSSGGGRVGSHNSQNRD